MEFVRAEHWTLGFEFREKKLHLKTARVMIGLAREKVRREGGVWWCRSRGGWGSGVWWLVIMVGLKIAGRMGKGESQERGSGSVGKEAVVGLIWWGCG
ncbi:hypothetical protein G4B88_016840 [Cannabis sativa]|uniref:Uncharacterized protein n=1 Tax=Cannabis sativa TaxID=3483 RepID=A0A7J6GMX9_CANSA|nr:hypothetical protein G4B88_016840 [Cannabis sativa]